MQKDLIASIFIVFFILNVTGQQIKLNGTYCTTEYITDFGMCFTFKKDNTFNYISGNDLPPNIVGAGTFKIDKNFLILNYESIDKYFLSYHKISQSLSKQDSISYHFKVRELNENVIPATEVIFENPETKIINGIILDKEGKGKLAFPKSADTLQLRFSYVGYNSHMVELKRDYDYYIEVFLAKEGQNLPISPHTETFEIISKDNSINLKNKNGELSKWFKRE